MPVRTGMLRQHGQGLSFFHRLLDVAIISVTLGVSGFSYGAALGPQYAVAAVVAVVAFLLFAEWYGLYGSWRADSIRHEATTILVIWGLTCCMLLALVFFSKSSHQFSRVTVLVWVVVTPLLLMVERAILRFALRRFRKLGFNSRAVAIVGGGKSGVKLQGVITDSPWMGMHVVGIYDNDQDHPGNPASIELLKQHVREQLIDCVYITYPMQQEDQIRLLVEQLADSTVSVYVVPDVFVTELLHSRWSSFGDMPLVSVYESPFYGTGMFLKRVEDVLLGSLILLLISPLLILIGFAVKWTSPGPMLFKQRRYGLNGQVIEVWKFRSMSVMEDGADVLQARKNDPRITPLGSFLRRTSLDELPQFINVLQGRMSIVGPRPHAIAHNEQYRKLIHGYMLRHKVKPGITGLAQVMGWRGETDTVEKMEMRVKYDLEYFDHWSIWLDLKIIGMTIFGGMRGKNAF